MKPFTFCGAHLLALPSGALLWPEQRLLTVSDLHLGKSERIARRSGQLLPPYEVIDTLVVSPYDGWVLSNTGGAILTLTTCHPKYSSRQRLIVRSELVAGPNRAVAHSLFPYVDLPSG